MNFKSYQPWDYSHGGYKYLDKDEELNFFYDSPFDKSVQHFYNGNGYYGEYRGIESGNYWDVNLIFQL